MKPAQITAEDDPTMKAFANIYEYYRVLFIGFKPKSFLTQSYMLFFLLRAILFGATISIFHEYPMVQIVSIIILNLGMLLYTLIARPFNKKSDFEKTLKYI